MLSCSILDMPREFHTDQVPVISSSPESLAQWAFDSTPLGYPDLRFPLLCPVVLRERTHEYVAVLTGFKASEIGELDLVFARGKQRSITHMRLMRNDNSEYWVSENSRQIFFDWKLPFVYFVQSKSNWPKPGGDASWWYDIEQMRQLNTGEDVNPILVQTHPPDTDLGEGRTLRWDDFHNFVILKDETQVGAGSVSDLFNPKWKKLFASVKHPFLDANALSVWMPFLGNGGLEVDLLHSPTPALVSHLGIVKWNWDTNKITCNDNALNLLRDTGFDVMTKRQALVIAVLLASGVLGLIPDNRAQVIVDLLAAS